MLLLKELQESFAKSVQEGDRKILSEIKQSAISPEGRMDVYRNNVVLNLRENLKQKYPAVMKLVGEEFFHYLAYEYIKKNHSVSGNLDDYGASLPEFIAAFEPCKSLPYLGDVAKLEWALHNIYFAPDAENSDISSLADMSPEELYKVRFRVHPAVRLVSSKYPIDKIHEFATAENPDAFNINLNERGANILVIRPELNIKTILLADDECRFVEAIMSGKTFYESYSYAEELNQDFNPADVMQKIADVLIGVEV